MSFNLLTSRIVWDKDGGAGGLDPEAGDSPLDPEAAISDSDQDADDNNLSGTDDEGGTPEITSYQTLYDSLSEDHRKFVDEEFTTLRSALKDERKLRRDDGKSLNEQLAALQKQVAKGSDAQKSLDKIIAERDAINQDFELASQRLEFYEEAQAYEKSNQVRLTNFGLAWVAVQEEKKNPESRLFDRQGRVVFDQLKEQFPELFAQEKPTTAPARTRAGAGTGQADPPPKVDMNTLIRRKAGYQ